VIAFLHCRPYIYYRQQKKGYKQVRRLDDFIVWGGIAFALMIVLTFLFYVLSVFLPFIFIVVVFSFLYNKGKTIYHRYKNSRTFSSDCYGKKSKNAQIIDVEYEIIDDK